MLRHPTRQAHPPPGRRESPRRPASPGRLCLSSIGLALLNPYCSPALAADGGANYASYGIFAGIALLALILGLALFFRTRTARQAGRELEERVAERTAALVQANQALEREVAARLLLQDELQQALAAEQAGHAAQKEFISMVSHEFRNPLAVIDTVAQRMEETLTERHPDLVASAGRMRRSVARLLALIENCLTEDRLSSPYMLPRVAPVDLALLLRTYFAPGKAANERIRLHLPDAPVAVLVDANLISTAISNLVGNALKYSPGHCHVDVTVSSGNGYAEVRVVDQGGGIAVDEQPRIFEKFYRAAEAQRVSGAGLGLYLARELAQRHGGDVSLAYSGALTGTCFVLTLPLPMARPDPVPAQPAESVAG